MLFCNIISIIFFNINYYIVFVLIFREKEDDFTWVFSIFKELVITFEIFNFSIIIMDFCCVFKNVIAYFDLYGYM